jgi:hypothetical protein
VAVLNRRNALLGWAVWTAGKRAMKVKARTAARRRGDDDSRRPLKGAAVALAATAVGAALVWRLRARRAEQLQ